MSTTLPRFTNAEEAFRIAPEGTVYVDEFDGSIREVAKSDENGFPLRTRGDFGDFLYSLHLVMYNDDNELRGVTEEDAVNYADCIRKVWDSDFGYL
jgi:hypothetical protein